MPPGTDYQSIVYNVWPGDVRFIYDLRYEDEKGSLVFEESIHPEMFALIQSAQDKVLADMFLYNTDHGRNAQEPDHRPNSTSLTDLLCTKADQGLDVMLITDEINCFYRSYASPILNRLESHQVKTVITDLDRLRDPNPLYSTWYRMFLSWLPGFGKGLIPHPFGHPQRTITLSALFRSLNFKANHRKVLVVDSHTAVVTSANPHDPSSLHSNIAIIIKGAPAREAEYAEHAVAAFSGFPALGSAKKSAGRPVAAQGNTAGECESRYQIQLLTEKKIKDRLIREIQDSFRGDLIMVGMLYLTHRQIIRELKEAAGRKVEVRIILDSSEHAFGMKKYGIPNRHAALDLAVDPCFGDNLNVRWYKTNGEQFHSKLVAVKRAESFVLMAGSANLTSRNLDNYNLELDLWIKTRPDSTLSRDVEGYFDRIWFNKGGKYTLDYDAAKDESRIKYLLYRFQEASGMCTY